MIATGLDRLLAEPAALAGRRYGLLAHGASVTRRSRAGPPRARRRRRVARRALFGPEHGYYGVEQDMVAAREPSATRGPASPIVSLYGDDERSLAACRRRVRRASTCC